MKQSAWICVLICLLLSSCNGIRLRQPHRKVIVIQPFAGFPASLAASVFQQIRKIDLATVLRQPIPLPPSAYYPQRARYRADSLIAFLKRINTSDDTVIIGLTDRDISATKGNVKDWGLMGLAYEPGRSCVVSTFRLSKENLSDQFYKVVVHELGHTQGLPHCPQKTCFMRSAEGGNPTDEEHGFCPSCKRYLIRKGWILQ